MAVLVPRKPQTVDRSPAEERDQNQRDPQLPIRYVGLDTETTGFDFSKDRVVEVALVEYDENLNPTGQRISQLVNPGIPMPPDVIKIHGITDEMVAEAPRFSQIAKDVQWALRPRRDIERVIIGQNTMFDLAVLDSELRRAGEMGLRPSHPTIDTLVIERKFVRHDLSSMHMRYYGKPFEGAHRAHVDVEACVKVLVAQIKTHGLGRSQEDLLKIAVQDDGKRWADFSRKLYQKDGKVFFSFGKFKDREVLEDFDTTQYANWMIRNDFPSDTKEVLRRVVEVGA